MAATKSTMLPLGTLAPDFSLPDTTGRMVSLRDFVEAPALLMIFMCNHCPFVRHIGYELAEFCREFQPQGLAVAGVNANDTNRYPEDSVDNMAREKARVGYSFPYLYDEAQQVAKAYGAACTPDFFLFDRERRLVYRGRFDASTPGNKEPVTGGELRAAVEAVLLGREVPAEQWPSIGCNIKWKVGNEPDYYR